MATNGSFLMHGLIYLQCFRKNKDFDPIQFEHSMILHVNCIIEIEKFFPYIFRKYWFYQEAHAFRSNVKVLPCYMYYLELIFAFTLSSKME